MPRLFQLEAAHFEKTFGVEHSRLIVWGSALTVQKGAAADAIFLAGVQTANTAIGTKMADLGNLGVYSLFWNGVDDRKKASLASWKRITFQLFEAPEAHTATERRF
jgi:hypothetical protein